MLELGVLFGLGALFANGIGNALSQIPVRSFGLVRTIFFRNMFTGLLLFVVAVLFSDISFPYVPTLLTILLGVVGYFGLKLFYFGLERGKVGIVIPVANSSVVVTILLSVLVFSEFLSLLQVFAIALLVVGVVLISVNFSAFRESALFSSSSGFLPAAGVLLIWGVFYLLLPLSVSALGPFITAFLIELVVGLCAGVDLLISRGSFRVSSLGSLGMPLLVGALAGIGTLSFSFGVSVAPVSIVAAIAFSSPLVSALYARLFFSERLSLQQWVAVFCIVCGVVVLSV